VRVMGVPVVLSGDWILNTEADDDRDEAWLAGAAVGQAREPRSWRLSWDYRRLEKDSLLGVFSKGDPGGGGTDVKGHRFGLEYVIVKNVKAGANYYLDKKNISAGERETDYRKLQLEISFQF
jgi:hypothetical protein